VNALRCIRVAGPCLLLFACGRIDTSVGTQIAGGADTGTDASLPGAVYIEAESGKLSGFTIESDPTASGGEYILPPAATSLLVPGDAGAEYTFTVASGSYRVWGRIHAPGAENNAFWVSMDQSPSEVWHLSTGVIWYWGQVTSGTDYSYPITFELDAGPHELVVNNAEADVGLDRLYVTSLGDTPVPANDTPCSPPNSIQLEDGGCEPSCGSHGNTTCGAAQCAGQPVLVSYDCTVCCFATDAGSADARASDARASEQD
jgi:hypothetical protein